MDSWLLAEMVVEMDPRRAPGALRTAERRMELAAVQAAGKPSWRARLARGLVALGLALDAAACRTTPAAASR